AGFVQAVDGATGERLAGQRAALADRGAEGDVAARPALEAAGGGVVRGQQGGAHHGLQGAHAAFFSWTWARKEAGTEVPGETSASLARIGISSAKPSCPNVTRTALLRAVEGRWKKATGLAMPGPRGRASCRRARRAGFMAAAKPGT